MLALRIAPVNAQKRSPEACSAASNLPRACCITRQCCCSTNPPPVSTRARVVDLWQYLAILRDEEKVTVIVTTHLMEEADVVTGWLFSAKAN